MIEDNLLLILSLMIAVSMLSMLSQKLRISYPILLVIAGLVIGFIPGTPYVSLKPDLVFLIFLPPLLYSAAWYTSWKDFWKWKRPIFLLAVGLVIFTSTGIAFLSNWIIPEFPLAFGFLLGGIISPPDAVAATSVLEGLKVPKRGVIILEGESLINDASSLIVFRFALAAIFTGQFSVWQASVEFLLVAGMGIIIGVLLAYIIYFLHRRLPTTPNVDTALTIISPYIMYIVAEHFHFSGVLAVVSGGLFLSYHSNEIFAYNTRIQTYAVWDTLIFLLNGLVFILIGLQLNVIVNELGNNSIAEAILYGVIISLVTILIRIVWVFPNAYLPRLLSKTIRTTEKKPKPGLVFLVAWSGMRGVVSLAAALAIPLTLPDGVGFPHRSLILFITFVVILFTLVLQGLSLPFIIRTLKIEEDTEENVQEQEMAIRLRLATAALDHMHNEYRDELNSIDAYSRLKERYERMIENATQKLLKEENATASASFLPKYREMLKEIVAVRRNELQKLREEKIYSEELIRNKERELDLEEARLNE